MTAKLPFEKEERKIIVLKESVTDTTYGKNPEGRTTEELLKYGIVNINKPSGPTSHQVADYVKKILNIKKCGHSGTLDPKVTGVLPIAIADATRVVQCLLTAGKEYVVLMHLHKKHSLKEIETAVKKFTGTINQLPPVRSAVKRQQRRRKVYYFDILEVDDQDVLAKVGCQAGTYVRKLVHDLGRQLKSGAHMAQLVRTKAGPFNDQKWHTLQDLKDAYVNYQKGDDKELRKILEPYENAVRHVPKIWVHDNTITNLCHGAYLGIPGISKLHENIKKDDMVAIMSLKEELICLGKAKMDTESMIEKTEGLCVATEKVFMPRNIYPKRDNRKDNKG